MPSCMLNQRESTHQHRKRNRETTQQRHACHILTPICRQQELQSRESLRLPDHVLLQPRQQDKECKHCNSRDQGREPAPALRLCDQYQQRRPRKTNARCSKDNPGVDPSSWTATGLILKPFRVLSLHARRHPRQRQTWLRDSFQSSGVRGSPVRCGGAWGCTSPQSR